MAASVTEPAKLYWTTGVAVAIVVHASAVAGAALLTGRYAVARTPTEISFSDEASPLAEAVHTAAEQVTPSETAAAAEPETLAPSVAPQAGSASAAEALQPVEAAPVPVESVQPSGVAIAPEAAAPEQVAALEAGEVQPSADREALTARPAEAVGKVEAAPLEPETPTPEVVTGASPEALQPSAAPEAAAESQAEAATALPGDALASAGTAEPVASATAEAAEAPAAAETVETAVVPEQPGSVPAQAPQAETLAALPPSEAAPVETAPQLEAAQSAAPASSAGETAVASTGAEAAQPLAHAAETVTGLEPETFSPSAETPGGGPTPETVVPAETESAKPVETALLVPARPDSGLGTEIDKPSDRYRKIVDFIRHYGGGDCFIALPAMNPEGAVTFQTFGRDKAREDAFRQALLGIDRLRAEISSGNVANPQCLALSFARSTGRYPGFSLMIDLDEAEMASGNNLSGSVLNAGDRDVHLLVVDDEGLVQSIDKFLARAGNDRGFSVPLTLTAGPVVTKQILMAITTDPPLPELADVNKPAGVFFRYLEEAIRANGADVDLAVEGFEVR